MNAVRVGSVRQVVCAAPAYLQRHGTPATHAGLSEHRIIAASAVSPSNEWKFQSTSVRVAPRLAVTSNDAALEAAVHGFGITRLLSYQVAQHVEARRLRIILGDFEQAPVPIHIVHREGRQASMRVRAFVDSIVGRLRQNSALQMQPQRAAKAPSSRARRAS